MPKAEIAKKLAELQKTFQQKRIDYCIHRTKAIELQEEAAQINSQITLLGELLLAGGAGGPGETSPAGKTPEEK